MATSLRCPSGHTWQANGSETVALCPVCGAAALDLVDDNAPTVVPTAERPEAERTIAFPAPQPGAPDTLYLGSYGERRGLVKSTDGGQTLQPLGRVGDFSAIVIDRSNPQVLYVGETAGRVIRSLDGGQTFNTASAGLKGMGVLDLGQDSSGTLYAWMRGGGLFASRDGATTWSRVDSTEALQRSGVEAGRGTLAVDPRLPGRVYLGNAGVIQIDN